MGIKQKRLTNQKSKLSWDNLLNNRCPKCGFDCEITEDDFMCLNKRCDFIINKEKRNEICDNLERRNRLSSMDGYGFENY